MGWCSKPKELRAFHSQTPDVRQVQPHGDWWILIRCASQWSVFFSGWWLTYSSEKYESQLGWWHSQYDGKNNKCSKPPTSIQTANILWLIGGLDHGYSSCDATSSTALCEVSCRFSETNSGKGLQFAATIYDSYGNSHIFLNTWSS